MVPGAVAAEPAPERVIAAPAATGFGVAASFALGAGWMVTVNVAGALCWPRLSVTTSENVTVPDVLGTVTVVVELAVDTGKVVGAGIGGKGTGIGIGGVGIGLGTIGVGIGFGVTGIGTTGVGVGVTGLVTGVVGVVTTGVVAIGAVAIGAVAIGAFMIGVAVTGAVAIGAVAIGAVAIGRGAAVTVVAAGVTALSTAAASAMGAASAAFAAVWSAGVFGGCLVLIFLLLAERISTLRLHHRPDILRDFRSRRSARRAAV